MITREADYAIRVVLCLASRRDGLPVSTTEVAETMFLPYRFLRKIVRKLSKAGLVASTRGKEGGIYLLRKPEDVSIHEILELFDPKSLLFNSCYQEGYDCPRIGGCNVHSQMKSVQEKINRQLRKVSFADLL